MEVIFAIMLLIVMGQGGYLCYRASGKGAKEKPIDPLVLQTRVGEMIASLTPEEWEQVKNGDNTPLILKAQSGRVSNPAHESIKQQLAGLLPQIEKARKAYVTNSDEGWTTSANLSKKAVETLELQADKLRAQLK